MSTTKYILSFKNGHKMNFDIVDGDQFIKDLIEWPQDKPERKEQFFVVPGIMINVTDLTAVHPDNMIA